MEETYSVGGSLKSNSNRSAIHIPVFSGSASPKLAEFPYEVADIFKAAVETDVKNGTGGSGKKCTGMFYPESNQVLHG